MALTFVPQVGQNLGNTQAPILANFTDINNNFDVDHVAFNSGADSGKHKKITFPVLYSTVGTMPAFGANEEGLFAAITDPTTATGTGVNEIFVFKNPSFGGGLGSQRFSITENRGNKAGEVAASYAPASNNMNNTRGYVTLPNGTFMQWCIVDTTANTVSVHNWPIPFVGYVFNVQLTQISNGTGFGEGYINTAPVPVLTQFRIQQKDAVVRRYMVLGIGTRY
jgi:hypothetical protein